MEQVHESIDTGAAPAADTVDSAMARLAMQRMRDRQNLGLGILAGLAASVTGAGLWALITVVTDYQIGWMAVGIGFLVGYAVRFAGKGIDQSFAVAGAALALFGCLLGNLLTVCYYVAENEAIPMTALLAQLNVPIVSGLMAATFSPIDLLFYGFAVYEGFHLATLEITAESLQAATTSPIGA